MERCVDQGSTDEGGAEGDEVTVSGFGDLVGEEAAADAAEDAADGDDGGEVGCVEVGWHVVDAFIEGWVEGY